MISEYQNQILIKKSFSILIIYQLIGYFKIVAIYIINYLMNLNSIIANYDIIPK